MERSLRADFLRLLSFTPATPTHPAKDPALATAEDAHECLEARYDDLTKLREAGGTLYGTGSRELLVLAGEAAVHLEKYDVASSALAAFYDQGSRNDQFLCRAYFLDALIRSNKASTSFGAQALETRKGAIEKVLSAVTVALENKEKYGFVVYNASVHFWNIVRPLMRRDRRRHVVAAFKTILSALDATGEQDVAWKVQLSLQCALCELDAGSSADAIKTIEASISAGKAEAAKESIDEKARSALERAVAEAEHVLAQACSANQSRLGDLANKARAAGDYPSWIECIRNLPRGSPAAQRGLKAILDAAAGEEREHLNLVDDIGVLALSTAGRCAIFHDFIDVANDFGILAKNRAKHHEGDVYKLLLWSEIYATSLCPREGDEDDGDARVHFEHLSTRRVKQWSSPGRLGAFTLERAVGSSMRLNDATIVEHACAAAWNIAVPLMKTRTRRYVYKLLLVASNALEAVDSVKLDLRSKIQTGG